MSTRSTITFREKGREPVARVYKHFDGYIDGLGHELAKWLIPMKIVNGISGTEQYRHDYANGIGCLAAKWIADNKSETGDIYLAYNSGNEDYNYEVILDNSSMTFEGLSTDKCITIEVREWDKPELLFKGTPSELLKFEEE